MTAACLSRLQKMHFSPAGCGDLVDWTMTAACLSRLQKMHFSPAGCGDLVEPTDDVDLLDSMTRWTRGILLTGWTRTATAAPAPPGTAGRSASPEREMNLTPS